MTQMTALILEDSRVQADIIGKLVANNGWATVHCTSLPDAVRTLNSLTCEVLLLDVFLGAQNIISILPQFRKLAPDATIALMTAGTSGEAIQVTLANARASKADFVLRKPFAEAQVKEILDNAQSRNGQFSRRKHVLVIDDSAPVRTVARSIYETEGYRVSTAASMEDAFASIDIAYVDLVLCDIFMPGMGGMTGMRRIRKTWPEVKIIAMSAGAGDHVSDREALEATREVGIDGQIVKPFKTAALIAVTDSVLATASPALHI